MTEALERDLHKMLRLRPGTQDVLHNRENTKLEFKQTFSLGNISRYAKTMIAYANSRGGYLVFGVAPKPHVVKGVNASFSQTDSAQISTFLREHVSPEIIWDIGLIQFHGKELGYLYTHENRDKPVMVSKQNGDLSEAGIYYRYNAQSCSIRFPELRAIIETRLGAERNAWMEHLAVISKAGPSNVGIVDTVHGTLHGAGGRYLIEEPLLRQLKLIREGHFVDTGGDPTLRLVGEVQSVGGVVAERPVRTGIHSDDLLSSFLAQRNLDPTESKSYLRETAYQNSFLFPVFYFMRKGGVSIEEAASFIDAQSVPFAETKRRLIRRVKGEETIRKFGAAPHKPKLLRLRTVEEALDAIQRNGNPPELRFIIRELITQHRGIIRSVISQLPLLRICESITHIDSSQLKESKSVVLEILLQLYNLRYESLDSNEKGTFRRCVCYLDQELFK